MPLPRTEEEWGARASAFIKSELKKSHLTYRELAKRLKKQGFRETEASITNKLKRGSFAASWFLACLAALQIGGMSLEEL